MATLLLAVCAVALSLGAQANGDPFQSLGQEDMVFTDNLPFRNPKAFAEAMKAQEDASGKGTVVDLGNGHYAIKIGEDQVAIGGLCNGQPCSTPAMRMESVPGAAEKFAALNATPAPTQTPPITENPKQDLKSEPLPQTSAPMPSPPASAPPTDPYEVGRDLAKLAGLDQDASIPSPDEHAPSQGNSVIYVPGAEVSGSVSNDYTYIKIAATANNLRAPQFDSPPPRDETPTVDPRPTRAARNK